MKIWKNIIFNVFKYAKKEIIISLLWNIKPII